MMVIRSIFVSISLIVFTFPTLPCHGQSKPNPLAERIYDIGQSVFVVNDLHVVASDIDSLLDDAGYGNFKLTESWFKFNQNSGIDEHAGALNYIEKNLFNANVVQYEISDRQKFVKEFLEEQLASPDNAEPFDIAHESLPVPIFDFMGRNNKPSGILAGNSLFVTNENSLAEAKKIADAPLLIKQLDATSQSIINLSGICILGKVDEDDIDTLDAPKLIAEYTNDLSDAEYEWLNKLAEIAKTVKFGLVGLKYEQQTLHFRSHAQFDHEKSLNELIDFGKTKNEWLPDLGFESDRLAFCAAIQMEAFRSSAAARVVPQILLRESGRSQQLAFLQGNMLRVLTELIGDSWNDLTAARIALYQNDEGENLGQFGIVGIADSQQSERVMTELRRLSQLTSPDALTTNELKREAEILRQIENLLGSDANLADRACTRLVLAGENAIPFLTRVESTANDQQKRRIQRIIRRIRDTDDKLLRDQKVIEPGFWTTLNPGLRLEESTSMIAGNTAHTIHVTPDPGKSDAEVAEAILMMQGLFGKQWDRIQVVQVADHFIFMIGSDNELLNRITKNVADKKCVLLKPLADSNLKPIRGQIQSCVNTERMAKAMGIRIIGGKGPDNNQRLSDQQCWIGLNFEEHAASADALIPVKQIVPFFSLGF